MRSWIRPRNSASDPSTRSAARETVAGGAALNTGAALRRRIRAIGTAILAPRISLCQLAIHRKHFQRVYFYGSSRLGGKRPLGLAVPVASVRKIALHEVHDAVRPAGERRLFVALHDLVRGLPVAGFHVLHRLGKLSVAQRHAINGGTR